MHWMFEHFKEGGWGMWPILFWSILTIGIIVERALGAVTIVETTGISAIGPLAGGTLAAIVSIRVVFLCAASVLVFE